METDEVSDVVKLPDEQGRVAVRLRVNGRERTVRVRPTETLLETLREQLKLHGARSGCEVGMCGSCTVLRDGQAVDGCLTMSSLCEDQSILTVEGLESESGQLSAVQEAFLRHRSFQCSYCTSGFVLALTALCERVSKPTEADVREAFSGHICRCGSYSRIMSAAMEVVTADGSGAEQE
jgi:xanthine dehydrogenase YagT iron-sulfur-binding subunit